MTSAIEGTLVSLDQYILLCGNLMIDIIDHFKVTDAILLGLQNYWGERAAN